MCVLYSSFTPSQRKFATTRKFLQLNRIYMKSCIKIFNINTCIQPKCAYVQRIISYCVKKSIHFFRSHLHGDFCCCNTSSCESSIFTSIMESIVPLVPIFLSSCCMCFGRPVGCKVQQWETSCPFFWKYVQKLCTLF